MTQPKHVVLVELENSHDECLYAQALFLESSPHQVSMILSPHAYENTASFHYLCQHVKKLSLQHGLIPHWKLTKTILRHAKHWKADVLVFNTAQGSFVRDFSIFSLFSNIRCIGVLHTLKKLEGSFTQKLISLKFHRYYLLSHILSDQLPESKKQNIAVFYPIFFHHPIVPKSFDPKSFTVLIPGGVENRRKDLQGWINLLKKQSVPSHWKFILAGKTDTESTLYKDIQSIKEKVNLQTFDHFIPQEEFFGLIESAHVLLPLIHPGTESHKEYLTRQISGTFNLAYGFKIPLLVHEAFQKVEEFRSSAFFYSTSELFKELSVLDEHRHLLEEKRKNILAHPLFQFEYQQSNYLKWIEL